MRRRLLVRAAIETAGFGAALLAVCLLALAAAASAVGPAGFWPTVTAVTLAALALGAMVMGVLRPARQLRDDHAAARRAGTLVPPLASDLLSAIQLGDGVARVGTLADAGAGAMVSPSLVRAFHADVARALAPVDPRALVPLRPAALAVAAFIASTALLGGAASLFPAIATGLRTLVHRPSLFEGAAVSLGAARGRRPHHLPVPGVHRAARPHRRGIDGRPRRPQGHARAHRDAAAAFRAQGPAAARRGGRTRARSRDAVRGDADRRAHADRRRELPLLAATAVRAAPCARRAATI